LNEEQAIASIIQRCLAARKTISAETGIEKVDIVVVSDGSTDRTVEIARTFEDIHLVVFPINQGYGAAIQAGWRERPNDLLAFLDADGTCDPLQFVAMCQAIIRDGHDVVLGSRMGPDSQMPAIRRFGNRCYAALLRLLSGKHVRDTASGMRVLRRTVVPRLTPLPTGLHFTPAMSARALLDDLKIAEIEMSYRERIGRSKLNVLRDGIRFLRVILGTALYVRPSKIILPLVGLLLFASAAMMAAPTLEYVQQRHVEEWMIYRFLFSGLLLAVSLLLLGAIYIIEQLIAVSRVDYQRRREERTRWWTRINERAIAIGGVALVVLGIYVAWPGFVSYARTLHVTMHWSRVVAAMFCELLAAQIGITLLLNQIVRGVVRQQPAWFSIVESQQPNDPPSTKTY
jgi:glycosyltransferase involved in cell wall biosynthesis